MLANDSDFASLVLLGCDINPLPAQHLSPRASASPPIVLGQWGTDMNVVFMVYVALE